MFLELGPLVRHCPETPGGTQEEFQECRGDAKTKGVVDLKTEAGDGDSKRLESWIKEEDGLLVFGGWISECMQSCRLKDRISVLLGAHYVSKSWLPAREKKALIDAAV